MDSGGQATQRVEIKAIQTCVDSYLFTLSFERSYVLLGFCLWSTLKRSKKQTKIKTCEIVSKYGLVEHQTCENGVAFDLYSVTMSENT